MGKRSQPRSGSLQFWPRKRSRKEIPSVNWLALSKKADSLLGFIAYKVGMKSVLVKDTTPNSMTKDKQIIVPVTILEAPSMKIFSVRLYKDNKVIDEILIDGIDKELKKKIKLPKKKKAAIDKIEKKDYDDLRLIVYSVAKQTGIKKKPNIAEIGLGGSKEDKLNFIKEHLAKEIKFSEIFKNMQLIDIRGITKGKGIQGPIKRFGISLKSHKSEKGRRGPGSIGPWHPAHTTFRVPMAGQLGYQTRPQYNNKIIEIGKISEKNINPKSGFQHYGNIKTEYIITSGSVQGPPKRAVLITQPLRSTKKTEKKNYEVVGLR